MTNSTTATVEVLTAEVRVLMVGSRQVTLSVVRQLDEVDGHEIVPFGRIRSDRKARESDIEVIGSVDGQLARSTGRIINRVCRGFMTQQGAHYGFGGSRGQRITKWCPEVQPGDYGHREHDWLEFQPSQGIYDEWLELPLIVLAGLR